VAFWLLKTEPGEYSFADLERAGIGVWDGVRNPQAQKFLRSMLRGDRVLIYHSGRERAAVGTARVVASPRADPADAKLAVVDLVPEARLLRPVGLAELKEHPAFSGAPLVRQGRLSVVPLSEDQWNFVLCIGEEKIIDGG
jgi:predicted RNA-binding protein with PUA-like domain